MDGEIVELQTRLAFQEETVIQLSDVLARQQRELDRLCSEVSRLQLQMRAVLENGAIDDPPPPHY